MIASKRLLKLIRLYRKNVSICLSALYIVYTHSHFSDDPEAYHGAPVAVQIIGRRLTEERIMAIAEEIGKLLGNEITP
jgi:Asp-tRNA(Asn)/Glu-tRNA(Gln) amidotransferase A subunit family amidase